MLSAGFKFAGVCCILSFYCYSEVISMNCTRIENSPVLRTNFAVAVTEDRIWVFGGFRNFKPCSDIWSLTSKGDWQKHADTSVWGDRYAHASIYFKQNIYLTGGTFLGGNSLLLKDKEQLIGNSDIWLSKDGELWSKLSDISPWQGRLDLQLIAFHGNIFLIGGLLWGPTSYTYTNDVWKSADGTTWECIQPKAPWTGRTGFGLYVLNGKLFLVGGRATDAEGGILGDLWMSQNGVDWLEVKNKQPWQKRSRMAICNLGDSVIMHGGLGSNEMLEDCWITKDGYTWESVSIHSDSIGPGKIAKHAIVKLQDKIFMFGGIGEDGKFGKEVKDMWEIVLHGVDGK